MNVFDENGPIDIMGCVFSDKAPMRQMSFETFILSPLGAGA